MGVVEKKLYINKKKLEGNVGVIVLKSGQTRVLRDNQHMHGTSLRLLFSLERCVPDPKMDENCQ